MSLTCSDFKELLTKNTENPLMYETIHDILDEKGESKMKNKIRDFLDNTSTGLDTLQDEFNRGCRNLVEETGEDVEEIPKLNGDGETTGKSTKKPPEPLKNKVDMGETHEKQVDETQEHVIHPLDSGEKGVINGNTESTPNTPPPRKDKPQSTATKTQGNQQSHDVQEYIELARENEAQKNQIQQLNQKISGLEKQLQEKTRENKPDYKELKVKEMTPKIITRHLPPKMNINPREFLKQTAEYREKLIYNENHLNRFIERATQYDRENKKHLEDEFQEFKQDGRQHQYRDAYEKALDGWYKTMHKADLFEKTCILALDFINGLLKRNKLLTNDLTYILKKNTDVDPDEYLNRDAGVEESDLPGDEGLDKISRSDELDERVEEADERYALE